MTTSLHWSAGSGTGFHQSQITTCSSAKNMALHNGQSTVLSFIAQIIYVFDWRAHVGALTKIWAFYFIV